MVLGNKIKTVTVLCTLLFNIVKGQQDKYIYYIPLKFKSGIEKGDTLFNLLKPVQMISKINKIYWIEGYKQDAYDIEINKVDIRNKDSIVYDIRRPVIKDIYLKQFLSDTNTAVLFTDMGKLRESFLFKLIIYPYNNSKVKLLIVNNATKKKYFIDFVRVNKRPDYIWR